MQGNSTPCELLSFWLDLGVKHLVIIDFSNRYIINVIWTCHSIEGHFIPLKFMLLHFSWFFPQMKLVSAFENEKAWKTHSLREKIWRNNPDLHTVLCMQDWKATLRVQFCRCSWCTIAILYKSMRTSFIRFFFMVKGIRDPTNAFLRHPAGLY